MVVVAVVIAVAVVVAVVIAVVIAVAVVVTIVVVVAVVVTIKTAAMLPSLLKVTSAVLRLMTLLTVLSHFFVKVFFSLSNTFVAVAPLVCPQRYNTNEQATAQQQRNLSSLSEYGHLASFGSSTCCIFG